MTKRAHSERTAWEDVAFYARQLQLGRNDVEVIAESLLRIARRMLSQLSEGVHANPALYPNPPLIIWGNPPGGDVQSTRVYEVAYQHVEDGKDYKHDFAPGVTMHLSPDYPNEIVLYRADGKRLWKDF